MPKYLTASQFRASDPGLPELASPALLSDVTLARYIGRAETLIDGYIGFDPKQGGGFEPHVIGVYQEAFDYGTRRTRFPLPVVPLRQVLRYRIQISNGGPSGEPLVATLLPTDCVINEYGGYLEVVPLTAVTYAVSPVIAELGLTQPIAQLDCEVGYYLISLGEPLIDSGNHQTFVAQRGFWATTYDQALHLQPNTLPPIPPVLYVAGTPLAVTTLTTALASGVAVTSLAVAALNVAVSSGATLTLSSPGGATATVTLSAPASSGATTLSVNSVTPAATFPVGTVAAPGVSVNLTEGTVTFGSTQTSAVTADYTYTIPDNVRDAALWQTVALLGERRLAQQGLTGIDQGRNDMVQIRRTLRTSAASGPLDTEVMAPNVMRLLSGDMSIPIG